METLGRGSGGGETLGRPCPGKNLGPNDDCLNGGINTKKLPSRRLQGRGERRLSMQLTSIASRRDRRIDQRSLKQHLGLPDRSEKRRNLSGKNVAMKRKTACNKNLLGGGLTDGGGTWGRKGGNRSPAHLVGQWNSTSL